MPTARSAKQYKAAYHQIIDQHEWPVAYLLVILNAQGYPYRAEIFFNTDAPSVDEDNSDDFITLAINEARRIITENYQSNNSNFDKLEVRLLNVEQRSPTTYFHLAYQGESSKPFWRASWFVPAIIAVTMILGGLYWGLSTLFERTNIGTEVTADAALTGGTGDGSNAEVESATDNNISFAVDNSELATNSTDGNSPSVVVTVGQAVSIAAETNGLPPSQNANNNLQVGQRVRVIPGSALTLRSQPGADAGEAIGFMQNAEEATIMGGPHWVAGNSDTIVWWYVELDDGSQAWAPANDSQFTLLEPAPRG